MTTQEQTRTRAVWDRRPVIAALAAASMPAPTAKVKVSDEDELEVWVVGEGTPVVLVHGALFWYLLKPLAEELAKNGDYQAIWYHRRGYNGKPTEPFDVSDQARDVVKILDELKISKAHIVGHSAGAPYALELAMLVPDCLLSAAMLDFTFSSPQVEPGAMIQELAGPSVAKAQTGDFEGAATDFLAALGATKEVMERALPGSWSDMVKDAPTWFQVEIPTLARWLPDPAKVKAIDVPIAFLSVGEAGPIHQTGKLLTEVAAQTDDARDLH